MDIHTVSIIGNALFDPISLLIKKLIEENTKEPNFGLINGLSVSICLLSVASLESYVMRARHINNARGRELDQKHAIKYIKDKYPSFHLEKEMTEVYILRDILTHNHLWEELYDSNTGESITERKSSGDRKFKENIDESTNKTKELSLNIYPTEVKYSDAKIVLEKVWEILLFLESMDTNICYVSNNTYVNYDNRQLLFADVLQKL